MRSFKITAVLLVLFALFAAFTSCGSSSSDSKDGKKSSVDGTIDGEKFENENDEALPNQFSAQIAGNVISIYLMINATSMITIIGESDETHKLPGNIKITEATFTDGTTIYSYSSGNVNINSCPKAIGDTFTGRLDNLKLKDITETTEKTINASFTVTVVNAAGAALVCSEKDSDDNKDDTAPKCGFNADKCDGGICCPFVECVNDCFIKNCLSKCDSLDTIMECITCSIECEETCAPKMTSACETAWKALDECMEENGCEDLIDDEEIECATTHCCDELKAAFQK